MAFIPDEPFPKSPGDDIRANDWNDLVEELKRLDTAKPDLSGSEWAELLTRLQELETSRVRKTGDTMTGNLNINGGELRFDNNLERRISGDRRSNRDAVVVQGEWEELEIKGRVIDWTGSSLFIGYDNDHSNNDIQIGRRVGRTRFYCGNPPVQTMLIQNNRVGIGSSNPAVKLHVDGNRIRLEKPGSNHILDLRADGGAMDIQSDNADLYINNNNRPVRIRRLVQSSSRALKEDVSQLSAAEAGRLLNALEPQAFRFKEDDSGLRHFGFIAEEMPEGIATPEKEGFNPTAVIAVLTKMVKQQQQELAALREEVKALREEEKPSRASKPASE
jgi:hypothetical protein